MKGDVTIRELVNEGCFDCGRTGDDRPWLRMHFVYEAVVVECEFCGATFTHYDVQPNLVDDRPAWMQHDLKTHPRPFAALWNGTKRCEVRKFDRPYRSGDHLLLREHGGMGYSGRYVVAAVTHIIQPGAYGLPADVGVMSINVLQRGEGG